MANKIVLFLNFLYFTLTRLYALGENHPIFINSLHENLIVNAGDNFTISCFGYHPLKWEKIVMDGEKPVKIKTIDVQPTDSKYKYGKQLEITNITYEYVGNYTCRYESEEIEEASSSIYLFVSDEDHLSVLDGIHPVNVVQYSDAVIPCRPTSPDVDVELHDLGGSPMDYSIDYDPKTGFTFYVSDLGYDGYYYCLFSLNGTESEVTFILKVGRKIDLLPTPSIHEVSGGHAVVGDKLVLECSIETDISSVSFKWIPPKGKLENGRMIISKVPEKLGDAKYFVTLTINNVTLADNGSYTCQVKDNQGHVTNITQTIRVFDKDEHFIDLREPNDLYHIDADTSTPSVQWVIDVQGHPPPELYWQDNRNLNITPGLSSKYNISFNWKRASLEIKNPTIKDSGIYTLYAKNKYEMKSLKVFLNVTGKPTVNIRKIDEFHMVNTLNSVQCEAEGNPLPQIYWFYKYCKNCDFELLNETTTKEIKGFSIISTIRIKTLSSGFIKCYAENIFGNDENVKEVLVSDVKNGFDIFQFDPLMDYNRTDGIIVAKGGRISMTCGVSKEKFDNQTEWLHNSTFVREDNDEHSIERSFTDYSYRATLIIPIADFHDSGEYSCKVWRNNQPFYKNVTIYVRNPQAPTTYHTNLNKDIKMDLPGALKLHCLVSGLPKPKIDWFKDGKPLQFGHRIRSMNDNQNITFFHTEAKDEGVYSCEASNDYGKTVQQVKLLFKNKPEIMDKWLVAVIVVLLIFLIVFAIFITIKLRKERLLKRELKKLDLLNFEKGAVENLNPELGVDDQAELLPYDKRWEFPIEKLKLGKQLGSGAFGVVMKGEARGIVQGEEKTTVAVKMVKKNADHTYIKALASELKIMVHLGKHLNVVNLLGACTKNVAKKELLVIVEYCRFGNLHNYLLRHRNDFINQVDKNGRVNFNIGEDILERSYSVSSGHSDVPVPHEMSDYRMKTDNTQMTSLGTDNEGVVLSNNSIQPEWRSNYKGDYKGQVKPICTKDLLAWAFQVARGMDYLASRKVLHGDLAARNILLAENNIVKICDFGLAKSMYKNDNYKKSGEGPLPVKWMAIESIRDRIFSTQSDVWSYGIVLWEFFSLARTPYPGMEADERLYNKLLEGYRMEPPEYSPRAINHLMQECWHTKPLSRPSFGLLVERLGCLLEESVRKYYVDLNDPYLVMNTQRIDQGNDYLAMLSPPNFENLSSPHHYVNEQIQSNPEGYLCMKPTDIFSPRSPNDGIFNFNLSNNSNKIKMKDNIEGNGNELRPMLDHNHHQLHHQQDGESDGEHVPSSPLNSISNPLYLVTPKVTNGDDNNEIKTLNNYINMPSNKVTKDKNPFVNSNQDDSTGVHYMNSCTRNWESVDV